MHGPRETPRNSTPATHPPHTLHTSALLALQDSLELDPFPVVQLPRPAGGVGLGELAGHRGSGWKRHCCVATRALLVRRAAAKGLAVCFVFETVGRGWPGLREGGACMYGLTGVILSGRKKAFFGFSTALSRLFYVARGREARNIGAGP